MIPDILVSKYLDGDLSIEEDVELRKRISEDPSAKEAFDAAILIHIAMSCADPIEVPRDVREDTLSVVFARIEASAKTIEVGRVRKGASVVRPMISGLALLLMAVIPFGDLFAPRNIDVSGNRAVRPSHGVPTQRGVVEAPLSVELAASVSENTTGPLPVPHTNDLEPVVDPSINVTKNTASSIPEPMQSDPVGDLPPWVGEIVSPGLAVILGTYVGTGIGSSNASLSNTAIFAQSIGYQVGENTIVGLEFGSISYENAVSTTANVGNLDPSFVSGSRVNQEGGQASKLLPAPPSTYTKVSMSTSQANTRLWGTAFLQQSLLRTEYGELHVKAGIGVDEVGLMGFGRISGQMRIQSWLAILIGAEARSFSSTTQPSDGFATRSSVGFLISGVAGIQITP